MRWVFHIILLISVLPISGCACPEKVVGSIDLDSNLRVDFQRETCYDLAAAIFVCVYNRSSLVVRTSPIGYMEEDGEDAVLSRYSVVNFWEDRAVAIVSQDQQGRVLALLDLEEKGAWPGDGDFEITTVATKRLRNQLQREHPDRNYYILGWQ